MFLPDLNGVERLVVEDVTVIQNEKEVQITTFPVYEEAWRTWREKFEAKYFLSDEQLNKYDQETADAVRKLYERQRKELNEIHAMYLKTLRSGAVDLEKKIDQYRGSFERHKASRVGLNGVGHQQERDWNQMTTLRAEAKGWITELDATGEGLRNGFWRVLTEDQKAYGQMPDIVTAPERVWVPNPITESQMQALDLAVTYGLTAIGLCLMLGLCTRLAALGGIIFLINVMLTTFPISSIYPPMPDMVGHFMFVSKDFIELVALLVIISLPVGRWAGLDFFLWNMIGKRFCRKTEPQPVTTGN